MLSPFTSHPFAITLNPFRILLHFRDGKAGDWNSLCRAYGLEPQLGRMGGTILYRLWEQVAELIDAGLLSSERARNWDEGGYIRLSDRWPEIQAALSLSLRHLAAVPHLETAMLVEPVFGRPDEFREHTVDLLVLMPFIDDLEPVFEDHIKAVANRLQLVTKRADDLATAQSVMKDVWSAICAARLVVADCTFRNPNVFYEVGVAHAIGKPVLLIAQSGTEIPFDIGHISYIEYHLTPRGMKEFEDRLTETIQSALGVADA